MEYQLTAELASPPEAADLDPLQQVGVVSLLDDRLNNLASIEGPDGVEIVPVEHSVEAHLGGAVVSWLLDAPALVFAEDATRAVLEQLIDEIDLLAGWEVKHCAVTVTDDQLASALAASLEPGEVPDGLPADLADAGEVGRTFVLNAQEVGDIEAAVSEAELAERRESLLRAGGYLRAFGLDAFGALGEESARYVAGALMHGIEMLTDELFGDVQLLDDEDATADEVEALWVVDELPQQYADRYSALFAKQFLVVTSILGHRLTRPGWSGPSSVAEALALRIAQSRAEVELDLAEVLDPDEIDGVYSAFNERALGGLDLDALYSVPEFELTADLAFANWFRPRPESGDTTPHPYLAEEDEGGIAPEWDAGEWGEE
ncbi:hypothetical protein SAXI111661_21760 [Saccharomonospora xinjiangensis]|uniref:hypothetical protein n=1 Tax=Saccharomonospora xinjiangensis TaxID=75294 RepID=UPI0010700F98|nr:hypothetical protein [Saccharomonospora xinjiangensis]QBQ62503.1 hypothetical protein EYD13_20875 [Saccharomonospora xinjiangensis]